MNYAYVAISSSRAVKFSVWAWNTAAIFSSSVMALLSCAIVVDGAFAIGFDICSFREEFFACTGILPET